MKNKWVVLLGLFLAMLTTNVDAQVSFGKSELINDGWKFSLNNPKDAHEAKFNDSHWRAVNLPHDWSVGEQLSPTLASCTGYLPGGIGWYRKNIDVPSVDDGKKIFLYFEGVYNRSEVFVNGKRVGSRPNGYISFMYDITPYVNFGGDNSVAVKVDHLEDADSRWYTGSGIYRNVWMVVSNPIHIAEWGVYAYPTRATKNQGVLSIDVEVQNQSLSKSTVTVINELYAADGKSVAKSSNKVSIDPSKSNKIATTLKVNKPTLWSLDSPTLYKLKTSILQDGKLIDEATTTTGFRSFEFDPNKGFALNGEWMKMKGVCLHHDAGVLGSAVPRSVWKRRLLNLKEIGVNAIRTSHNPQAPDLYALCDEVGMLVLDEAYDEWEFPKRKWMQGWNVGTPAFQGSYDIFKEWAEKDIADLVRRDRNHVSIFAWSVGNEVDYPNDPYSHPVLDGDESKGFTQAMFGGYKKDAPDAHRLGEISKSLVKAVREYDPYRATTAGLAGVAMSNQTDYPGALDIVGYNYTESMYDTDHARYPNRVIYGSENRHELEAWKAVRDKDFIFGQFLWTGIDYLGESGRWPSRGFYSGLLDFGGFIKPRGYFRKALWTTTPTAYLGTYPTPGRGSKSMMKDVWSQLDAEYEGENYVEKIPSMDAWPIWNYNNDQLIRVVCYTNTAQAKLLLNNIEVGEVKPYDDNTGIIYWDIPFALGKLEVVGMDEAGQELTRHNISSSDQPYALKVVDVDTQIELSGKGLAQVTIQVVDKDGIPVMLADNEITCLLNGSAELLGLEGSNNEDMTDYTDNKHRAFHGRLMAYIQFDTSSGKPVQVKLESPWLKSAEVELSK